MKIKEIIVTVVSFINISKRNFGVFLIMILSLSIAVFCSQYLTLMAFKQFNESINDAEQAGRKIVFQLNGASSNVRDNLLNLIEDNNILPKITQVSLKETFDSGKELITIMGIQGEFPKVQLIEGDVLQTSNANNDIVVSSSLIKYDNSYSVVGNQYRISNQDFIITGVISNINDTVFIKYEAFNNENFSPSQFIVLFENRLSSEQYTWISEQVFDLNSDISIIQLNSLKAESNKIIYVYGMTIICLYLFVVVNIIMLFRYWILRGSDVFRVYRICGASNRYIYLLIIYYSIGLSIIAFLVGNVSFILISKWVHKTTTLQYFGGSTSISFLLLCLIIMLTVHRDAVKISSSWAINKKNEV